MTKIYLLLQPEFLMIGKSKESKEGNSYYLDCFEKESQKGIGTLAEERGHVTGAVIVGEGMRRVARRMQMCYLVCIPDYDDALEYKDNNDDDA